jgi:hypothetical protein
MLVFLVKPVYTGNLGYLHQQPGHQGSEEPIFIQAYSPGYFFSGY